MIDKLNEHYSFTASPSVFDEEALTALELVARTAAKVNEVIDDQNELQENTAEKIAAQNETLQNAVDVVIPAEVKQEIDRLLAAGEFDKAIALYLNDLNARVDNLLGSVTSGSTTMDAEVIDIRVDTYGVTHENAGNAVRHQAAALDKKVTELGKGAGVYTIPLEWHPVGNTAIVMWSEPFAVPAGGFRVCIGDEPFIAGEVTAKCYARVRLGHLVNGEFVMDEDVTKAYCSDGVYSHRLCRIPYLEGYHAVVQVQALHEGATVSSIDNYTQLYPVLERVKVYAGTVTNSSETMGFSPVCIRTTGDDTRYNVEWAINGLIHKYQYVATPLALDYVQRVTVSHTHWIGAKVYKFDPATRTTAFVETLAFNESHPCFGCECVLDFSNYGKNHFAILIIGKVPWYADYENSYYFNTAGTKGVALAGLDLTNIEKNIFIEWAGAGHVRHGLEGASLAVQKNIELVKSLVRSTPAGWLNQAENQYQYLFDVEDFAGMWYGGGYQCGSVFYHVSPATYYTALLNPASVAYGNTNMGMDGYRYGVNCSVFTSMLHGHPIPLSTFDMRYNTPAGFDIQPFDIRTDLKKLKAYDVLTQGAGNTGHCVLLTDIITLDNEVTAVKIMEAATPATREDMFFLHNGLPYKKDKPEEWYAEAYDYVGISDPKLDKPLHELANWTPKYTTPQKVMCSRGYGSIYLAGKHSIRIAVTNDVETITIYQDGAETGTYTVVDLAPSAFDKTYRRVDITELCSTGTVTIKNNVDDGEETFHIIDVSDYTVNAVLDGDMLTLSTSHNDKVKYINIVLKDLSGKYSDGASFDIPPAFDDDGKMVINTRIATETSEWALSGRDEPMDSINVIFKTDYDTNTFAVDAQNDRVC